ncbi:hypothetical protein M569_06334, partial [Genlisea aurea]
KIFRGRRVVESERFKVRQRFFLTYGQRCEQVNRQCFGPKSNFLYQLVFFFNPRHVADFSALVEICRLLCEFAQDSGDIVSIFAGSDYLSHRGLVDYRIKILAHACILAVYENRSQFIDQLFMTNEMPNQPVNILMDAMILLIDGRLPWACKTVCYLCRRNAYSMFREIILTVKKNLHSSNKSIASLEHVLALFVSHADLQTCTCSNHDPQLSFVIQIIGIPFLWQLFPNLKEVFASHTGQRYVHQMADYLKGNASLLLFGTCGDFPVHACVLGNLLEAARVAVLRPDSSDWAMDFAIGMTLLLQELSQILTKGDYTLDEDEVAESDVQALDMDLKQQIFNALDPQFLQQLTNVLLGVAPPRGDLQKGRPKDKEVAAVTAACSVLYVTFNVLPLERLMTVLAYRTELVAILWNFMKRYHENEMMPSISEQSFYLTVEASGLLLPLAVFCPVYKHMLMIVDNEFYELGEPLSLKDIKLLIVILKQTLWQILWLNPSQIPNSPMSREGLSAMKKQPLEFLQYKVCMVASELMSQLQHWNSRREFTSPSDFNVDGAGDMFMSQAITENSRANEVLRLAPFLVPFTIRAKIFNSQLGASRKRDGAHSIFTRTRFKMRRDHILEDAFSHLNALSEEDLRGVIRISFVNELGVEEAGIDGGGIFKDFMENITRSAFDVQYGLFKETADHLLYPNPGSGLVHENHHQYFHFLGTILAKAMFEGILVDIPFATFFLSKLKQKYNYLNDLPSLDPELYRHLIFLKHYKGNISQLELYFVIVNNEYGEQTEEELLPGGKSMRVTNDNVITFIHLVANYRLNFQIREQSAHFLRGFQHLIKKDWIDMFNEHELQLLISGSVDGMDVDDLRSHANYSGGY